jgi:hypothetical protein
MPVAIEQKAEEVKKINLPIEEIKSTPTKDSKPQQQDTNEIKDTKQTKDAETPVKLTTEDPNKASGNFTKNPLNNPNQVHRQKKGKKSKRKKGWSK